MRTAIILILLVVFAFAAPVDTYGARKDTKVIMEQLQTLQETLVRLDGKLTLVTADTAALLKRMQVVEEKVSAVSRLNADSGQDSESLKLSLQFIKEELNEFKSVLNKISDRLMNLPTGGVTTEPQVNEGEAQAEPVPAQSPETTYYTAYSDYIKKNYQLAIDGFKQFIRLFPQNILADNSLYWIGECYYSQKNYQEAVSTFTQLITNYSDGDKIPDAILKKGYALIEMGKQTEGVDVLKELISRFPLSEEASLAQQKIKDVMD